MADRPIQRPVAVRTRHGNEFQTLGGATGLPNNANVFKKRDILTLTSGVLVLVGTDGVLAIGQAVNDSLPNPVVVNPPTQMLAGNFPLALGGTQFYIQLGKVKSTTDVTVGVADTAPTLADVTIGASYALWVPTTGTYAFTQFLDPTDTTNTLVVVVDKPVGQVAGFKQDATTTYNPVVLVEIIGSKIQVAG